MIQRVELFAAIQYAIQGKLSVNLIKPNTLHNGLQNVSLHLPEGYELITGTRTENIHLYYNFITLTISRNIQSKYIVLHVSLKNVDRHFALYKLFVLPTRMYGDTFVKYSIEFPYFDLSDNQHGFILLTKADLSHCKINGVTVCPADVAIYNSQTLNCESSLFFKLLLTKTCVEEVYYSTTKIRHVDDIKQPGFIIFRNHIR